jgi:N6-L-threonylcarbamoyladenine synthase
MLGTKSDLVLGIETSCDDTSVALVNSKGQVKDLRKWTQDEDHIPFGGIVPERASRNHLKFLIPLIEKVLNSNELKISDLKGVAVTNRPGLQGSLIVGAVTAETLAAQAGVPLTGVNHLVGHLYSPYLVDDSSEPQELLGVYPQLSLVVSGGHTQLVLMESPGNYRILGRTRDDAAGEALDKFSNLIGLGFPGGPKVDQAAQLGRADAYSFPRPMMREQNYDFSFSGLKAAGARLVEEIKTTHSESMVAEKINDLCASYLQTAVDVLIHKTERALIEFKPKVFTIVGGVSANSFLRDQAEVLSKKHSVPFLVPKLKFCTDNGAMIALVGALQIDRGQTSDESLKTFARSLPGDFR